MHITSRLYTYLTLLLRHFLLSAGGILVARGQLGGSSSEWIGGILLVIVTTVWGLDAQRSLQWTVDAALQAPRGTTREQLRDQMWH